MDRFAWALSFVAGVIVGRGTSPEVRRRVRWWLARIAKGDAVVAFGSRRIDLTLPAHWKPEQKR